MSSSNSLFTNQSLQFERCIVNTDLVPVSNITDPKFGILSLVAISSALNDRFQEFIFTVDCSGSMSDECSDGRTKMQHIIHTLKNMILYFKENSIKAFITINAFDDKNYKILERSVITDENFSEINSKVQQITPRGSTDIESALKHSREILSATKTSFPDHDISHIFMTDGEATSGNNNPNFLAQIVDIRVTNAFIGFGIQHDTVLLNELGSCENSGYYFVDKLENCGLVYGEILHSILYKLIDNVTISIENGLVYDFKNNIWVSSLNIGQIVSESNKIYHIVSSSPSECVVTFSGKKTSDLTDVSFVVTGSETDELLSKYIYRQRTLQYLFKVNKYLKTKNINTINLNNWFLPSQNMQSETVTKEEECLIQDLIDFITEMKKYMSDNDLSGDGFMKNLCDDIYICYRTFGTKFGIMYIGARQTSQGTQRGYTVSHTPDDISEQNKINSNYNYDDNIINSPRNNSKLVFGKLPPPKLQRHFKLQRHPALDCFNFNNLHMLQHELSDFTEAPYLTPTSAGLMREISCSGSNDAHREQEP